MAAFGETRRFGGRDFGAGAVLGLSRATVRWFDFWLKGRDNGIGEEPPVAVFVTGSNRWRRAWQYPMPGTSLEKWYLRAGPRRNRGTAGILSRREPGPRAASSRFAYDPADPTPEAPLSENCGKPGRAGPREVARGRRHASEPTSCRPPPRRCGGG